MKCCSLLEASAAAGLSSVIGLESMEGGEGGIQMLLRLSVFPCDQEKVFKSHVQ